MHGCQKTSQNADDIESLAKRIKTLAETFEKATERGVPLSKAMLERTDRLSKYVVITAQVPVSDPEELQDVDQRSQGSARDRIPELHETFRQSRQRCSSDCGPNYDNHLVHSYIHSELNFVDGVYC
jgi:hypothetical protein